MPTSSPCPARKLLEFFSQDMYFNHVDLRMMAYSVDTRLLENFEPGVKMAEVLLQIRKTINHRPVISSYSCDPPLFSDIGKESRRSIEDTQGLLLPERIPSTIPADGKAATSPSMVAG
jgi:hypothetical protein